MYPSFSLYHIIDPFSGSPVWTGLTDLDQEGVYKFVDGTFPETEAWFTPSGQTNDNCALLNHVAGLMQDSDCSTSSAYMCETPIGKK
jgi:hypothetical protein